jgi:solute:Na+ symporter, SSS family
VPERSDAAGPRPLPGAAPSPSRTRGPETSPWADSPPWTWRSSSSTWAASPLWGAWLGRNQRGGTDYFLGNRDLPWWAVGLSVVATETSTLTFLSIPGVSYLGTLAFLQLTLGYLAGRIVVSLVLLPAYYRGEIATAYTLLERRFGTGTRRFTSGIFQVTRLLADSVRLFATAIPLALITGWPYALSIAVIGVLTLVYTYFGGIRAVVWVDVVQMILYVAGPVPPSWSSSS